MKTRRWILSGPVACAALLLTGAVPPIEERLEQDRNLGKAFYENPTTANEAVSEFKKALDLAPGSSREKLNYALALLRAGKADQAILLLKEVQKTDPKLPHTWFNLGIYYRKNGDAELAVQQFEGMLRLTPNEPIVHYQLGALFKQLGRSADAIAQFEQASKLNPLLAGAHFQLYNLYRQAGRTPEATQQLQTFQALKKQQEGAAVPEDVDWCNYAEIYDPPRSVTPAAIERKPVWDDKTLDGQADPKTAGLATIDSTGKGQVDLLVWSSSGVTLYRQGLNPVPDSGLAGIKGVLDAAPGDFDNDGLMDLAILTESGPALYRNTGGKFVRFTADLPHRRFERAVWIDYDHDYDLDLVLLGESSALFRNQGAAGFADRTADFPFVSGHATGAYKLRVVPDSKAFDLATFYKDHTPIIYRDELGGHYRAEKYSGKASDPDGVEADFNGDGRNDRARIEPNGAVHLLLNKTKSDSHWIRIQLAGVKSLKLGQDAEIEIKAGTLYRKQMYKGVPVVFDLGPYNEADVVRITWINGLIQNETKQAANKSYRYEEAQRLSGSCPMIWTWNGRGFQFITDVLGVAPLGASDGDGSYFPVDHDEYVSIPGAALKPVDGHYDVRITEELSEVSYLDQVRFYAVDHPADTEVFTNEKFKSPPYPEFRLFGVTRRIYPRAAHDDKGRDVLPALLKTDA
jgi:tetratricopeptide (TPR) repeat protein